MNKNGNICKLKIKKLGSKIVAIVFAILIASMLFSVVMSAENAHNEQGKEAGVYSARPLPRDTAIGGGAYNNTKAPDKNNLLQKASSAPGYCPSYGGSHAYEYISSVTYTQNPGGTMTITVDIYIANPTGCTYGNPCPEYDSSPEYVNVWVDWDGDKVFESGEKVIDAALTGYSALNYHGTMTTSKIVTIPPGAVGSTWMRTNLGWGYDPNDPCDYSWTWGDIVDKEVELLNIKVVQLDALNDVAIRDNSGNDITDPIWKKQFDANGNLVDVSPKEDDPIADDMITGASKLKIEATLKGFPSDPSWTPEVEYEWKVQGTSASGSGNFNGLSGTFDVTNPQKVGEYTLNLKFTIKDDQGNVVSTQQIDRTLYVLYKPPITSEKPKIIWLDKATEWASGATDPIGVVSKLTTSITYVPLWTYKGHHGWDYVTGIELVESTKSHGSCGSFKECLRILSGVHGVPLGEEPIIHQPIFLTKPLISLDGNTGNAYEDQKTWPNDRDRWVFGDHVVAKYDGKYYDPTFRNNVGYTDVNKNIYCWGVSSEQDPDGTVYISCDSGHPTKVYPEQDGSPQAQLWGKWRYKKLLPDLTLTSVNAPTSANPGDNIVVSWTVKNQGDSSSGSFYNRISLATTPYGTDISLGNFEMNSISSGSSSPDSKSVQVPQTVSPGSYYVTVYADAFTDVTESDENNNIEKAPDQIQIGSTSSSNTQSLIIADMNNIAKITQAESMGSETEFTGNFNDYGVDTDDNGLFDLLIGEVEIDVAEEGYYSVLGILSSNQNDITMTTAGEYLNVGTQTVKLYFIGKDIYNAKISGVYNIKAVLYDASGSQIDYESFSTSAYEYTEYQGLLIELKEITDYGEDIDNDNLFNYLTVELTVNTIKEGNYGVIGVLHSKEMKTIGSSTYYSNMTEGTNEIYLNFDGAEIRKSKVDGPYIVGILLMDEEHHTSKYEELPTSAYSYTDFQQPSAFFRDIYSDYGMDTDGDGRYNYLTTGAEVNILIPGTYTILGWLSDSSEGSDIIWDSGDLYLDAGVQSMQLNFDGMAIYKHGTDGPYTLSFLALYDENDNLVDYQHDAYTTAAYNYTDFQKPEGLLVELTGNYNDYGTDTDSDELYDYLTVDVEVIPANAGNIVVSARLMDSNGEEIIWATNTVWLDAGLPQNISLNFDGRYIYGNMVDGPYYVRDVYVYHTGDPTLPDYVYDAHTTTVYSYTEFEESGVITGTVTDAGMPVENAFMSINGGDSDYTNAAAGYNLVVLQDGTYTVNIEATGYDSWKIFVNSEYITDGNSVDVSASIGEVTYVDFTQEVADTEPPTIESATLDAYTVPSDSTIHITVEATDNIGVTSVTADGIDLTETENTWQGDITTPTTPGDYTITIHAEDAQGNFDETTVDYSVVTPQGGLGVAVLPRMSPVTAGSTVNLEIKVVSTENFDDTIHVYLSTDGLPEPYKADLSWLNWTEADVEIPAGGEVVIPLEVNIPGDASGYKMFRANGESTKWTATGFDTGILFVS